MAAAPTGLDSIVGSSSTTGTRSGVGHEDVPELELDTTVDVLSQLKDALDTTHPSQGG
jgi:hypothetical protein